MNRTGDSSGVNIKRFVKQRHNSPMSCKLSLQIPKPLRRFSVQDGYANGREIRSEALLVFATPFIIYWDLISSLIGVKSYDDKIVTS